MGNKAKATELLREAELILASHRIENIGDMGPYSTMGAAYFLRDEIASLKQKLGLGDEVKQDVNALEKSLLPEGSGVEALEAIGIPPLIECAIANKDASLLARIEEVVLKEDDGESSLGLKIQVGLAEAKIGNVEKGHRILKSVAETEPRWANAKGIVEATLALADIGFAQEALTRMEEIQRIKDEPNRVGVAEDYLYIVSGRVRAKLGLVEEARQDFQYALESCNKHRYKGDDWAFLHIIEAQLEYKEYFLDDALQTASLLRDYRNRTEALIKIALAYHETGNKQKSEGVLSQALKMVENIEEDSMREIVKFRILVLQQENMRKLLQADEDSNRFTFPDFGRPSLFSDFSLQSQWRSVGQFDTLDTARKAILSSDELICHAQVSAEPTLEQLRALIKTGSLEIGLAKKDNAWFLFKGLRGGVIIPFNECEFRLHSHPKRITKEIGRAQDKYIYPDVKEDQDAKEKRKKIEYILTDQGLCAYGAGIEKPFFASWRELLAANIPISKLDEYFIDKQSKDKMRPLYTENANEKKLLAKSAEYLGNNPVNERIDLSAIPKEGLTKEQQDEQLERNMETLARQIAWHNTFGLNIRYVLENDTQDKKAQEILKNKIIELGKIPGVNAEELLSRIGNPHAGENVIEVILRSVENVKAMKQVEDKEFVVALKDDLTKEGVAIPNYTAASAIGLSIASLRIAKEKETKPDEYNRVKDKVFRVIKSIYERYNIITKEDGFTLDDLEFMVTGCPENKLYYAILYALPPIAKDLVERIGRYHEALHLILQAA